MLDKKFSDWVAKLSDELEKLTSEDMEEYRELFGETVSGLRIVTHIQNPVPGKFYVSPIVEEVHSDNISEYVVKAGLPATLWLLNRAGMKKLCKMLTFKLGEENDNKAGTAGDAEFRS